MKSILTKLAEEKSATDLKLLSRDSYYWIEDKIRELRRTSSIPASLAKENFRQASNFKLGQMYFFYYDPKGKSELPYYDRFPLVILLEKYPDGFLGLNLHYLPLKYRMAFMSKLVVLATFSAENEIKRIRATYDILNATKRFKEFRPCLKRYLLPHVQSKILQIQPNEWEIAAHLPIHHFKKASPKEVWQDSIDEIKGS